MKDEYVTSRRMIRSAYKNEWDVAMDIAWDTFMQFEATDYSSRGIESFREFITDPILKRMFLMGSYQLFVAVEEGNIVGIISLRNETHISLLFVDAKHHYQGIGRDLIRYVCDYVDKEEGYKRVTVNAAPYALEFYHKLGFRDTGNEETNDGIRFTPMEKVWRRGQI